MSRPKLETYLETSEGTYGPIDYTTRFSHIQKHFANPSLRLVYYHTSANPNPQPLDKFKWHAELKDELIRCHDRTAHLDPVSLKFLSPAQLAEAAAMPWVDMREEDRKSVV